MPKKNQSPIAVAFCFDENMWMLAGVAIRSLLYHKSPGRAYNIYCVVPPDLADEKRSELADIVARADAESCIIFLNANSDFNKSVVRQYTVGIYYRFMLARLLPDVDRIIYCDADVAFCGPLDALYDINMADNIIAGVRDVAQGRPYPAAANGYINSGVLVMNLAEIRRRNMYSRWRELSMRDDYAYPDQDILNQTCDGKILYLPPIYNYMPGAGNRMAGAIANGVYSARECEMAAKNPVIIHYILRQPWNGRANVLGHLWWRYAAMTPFYDAFLARLRQSADVIIHRVLLFNFINIMTVKVRQNLVKYYLFGIIPIIKVKSV